MRDLQNRSDAYAEQATRDMGYVRQPLPGLYEQLRAVIAQAFRDGAMAELGDTPLMSAREAVRRAGRK